MSPRIRSLAVAVLAALLLQSTRAQAADPTSSTITIPEMDCATCAKKLGETLGKVPGVAKLEYDVKARIIKVTHRAGATPSPKALWEAVEKGGKDPSKLEAPGAAYTKKPTS